MTESAVVEARPAKGAGARVALRILQLGAVAIVAAVTVHKEFELDRFLIPKELVLHLAAFLAGAFALRRLRMIPLRLVDVLLLGWLALGALSAVFATNPWLATRALAISVSSVLLFWTARALHEAGLARPLLQVLAFAVVLVAATALLQTYGVRTDVFSINRAPGGTLGNRNFIAHAAAFGFPIVLFVALAARRFGGYFIAAISAGILTGTLVLTRSRAAWLAFAAAVLVALVAAAVSPCLRRSGQTWGRIAGVLLLAGGGVAAALLIPNTLEWRSDDPYLDTVRRLAEYDEGSGRGRLIQYGRSLGMAVRHPLLGVGPGNWPVVYPEYAARRDPSIDPSPGGMTFNPWPSSDWIAWIAERGIAAVALLTAAFILIVRHAVKSIRTAGDHDECLRAISLLASSAAAAIAGLFDAVLLLALPSLLVWTALGALWTPSAPRIASEARRPWWTLAIAVLVIAAGAAAVRSGLQIVAMEMYATRSDRATLAAAARIDPGNYRLRLRLGGMTRGDERCAHALAARALHPQAAAARRLARGCD